MQGFRNSDGAVLYGAAAKLCLAVIVEHVPEISAGVYAVYVIDTHFLCVAFAEAVVAYEQSNTLVTGVYIALRAFVIIVDAGNSIISYALYESGQIEI